MQELKRCEWVSLSDPLYVRYHDEEWGVPIHEENKLFEFLVLGGAQAGLSWKTILSKREAYRKAYEGFDPGKIAPWGDKEVNRLLSNPGIIRNKLKIQSSIRNAKSFLEVQREFGSFEAYIWKFVNFKPKVNGWVNVKDIPAKTPLAEEISKDLIKRGFRFVGPTISYAFMQAAGIVNDHVVHCFRYRDLVS